MPVSNTTLPKMRFQVVKRDLWKLRVPLKIKIFHWFSKKGMTPTKANLANIYFGNTVLMSSFLGLCYFTSEISFILSNCVPTLLEK